MRTEPPAVAGRPYDAIMVKARDKKKETEKYGSEKHLRLWRPTQFKWISQRENHFRVRRIVESGARECQVFTTLHEAKDFVTSSGLDLIKDRTKREKMTDMVEKARHYLDWVAQTKYEPGDTTIANSIRGGGNGFISRAAPCTYMLGIEGKEAPWWGALLQAYHMLSHREKSMLTLLTSDVQAEWMRAAKLQHRVYSEALRTASRPAFHRARGGGPSRCSTTSPSTWDG